MENMSNLAISWGARVLVTGSTGSVGSAVTNELLKAGLKVRAIVRNLEKGVSFRRFRRTLRSRCLRGCTCGEPRGPRDVGEGNGRVRRRRPHGDRHLARHEPRTGHHAHGRLGTSRPRSRGQHLHRPARHLHLFGRDAAPAPRARAHHVVLLGVYDVVRMAWSSSPPPDQDQDVSSSTTEDNSSPTMKSLLVYAASKIEAERACWAFMSEGDPKHFVLNTVVPMTCLGAFVHPRLVSSMNGMLLGTWRNDPEASAILRMIGAQCHVDLEDLGLLHLAALVLDEVRGERIVAMGEVFGFGDVLDVMRRIDPERELPGTESPLSSPMVEGVAATVDRGRYRELLARMGKGEPAGLEESIRRAVATSSS
ncbi:NAD(P)-binding Rossmann-fold containing protein [Apiospora hydei]|uniref:NAD(P)-binding Rossmann-fold containing protein n=1 Tax=Apiospora hydei TaxID=1337664 RepID=A0ABR1VIT6_9PEZI